MLFYTSGPLNYKMHKSSAHHCARTVGAWFLLSAKYLCRGSAGYEGMDATWNGGRLRNMVALSVQI